MKTEYEIKEELEKSIKYWDGGRTKEVLKWVLEEPKYKRTIFELTDDEIEKLVGITLDHDKNDIVISLIEIANKYIKLTITFQSYVYDIYGQQLHVLIHIDNTIDIYGFIDYENDNIRYLPIFHYDKFIDTIREMLSQEKPK